MRHKKYVALLIGLVALLLLLSSGSEMLFEATPGKAHLYPFGSEHVNSFFYRSLNHYRVRLAIDIATAIGAIIGVLNIWQRRKFTWILCFPFLMWVTYVVVSARFIK